MVRRHDASTIGLAHSLGLSVIAERVEDEPTLGLLAGLGCDAAQGYYISRPLVPEDLAAWLVANAQTGTRAANDFEDRRAA